MSSVALIEGKLGIVILPLLRRKYANTYCVPLLDTAPTNSNRDGHKYPSKTSDCVVTEQNVKKFKTSL